MNVKEPRQAVHFASLFRKKQWQPVGESNPSYLVENQVS